MSTIPRSLVTPSLAEVLDLATELGIKKPVGNRPIFDIWFLALHEIGHYAVVPQWYRNYAQVIHWNKIKTDKPCAPLAPDLWMLDDPTPDEECVRLWTLQVCELKGWINPIASNPSIFGGSNYNPRQWYIKDTKKVDAHLRTFDVDVKNNVLVSQQKDIELPCPQGKNLKSMLVNHDYIYQFFNVPCRSANYDKAHLIFLQSLCDRL